MALLLQRPDRLGSGPPFSWSLEVRGDLGGRVITAFSASPDGRWVAIGIDDVNVELFDTEQLDPKGQPTLVKHFDMP